MAETRALPITETAEFKAALDAAVTAALGRFQPPPAPVGDGAIQLADRLSVQLAKLTGQGIGQSYVDPEIIARRADAHRQLRETLRDFMERDHELRIQGRAPQHKPKWKLIGQVHMPLGEAGYAIINPLYRGPDKRQKATEISHYAEPNLAHRPLNEPAERVWSLFCASIGRNSTGEDDAEADELGDIALTMSGAVVRGRAAEVAHRNDPAFDGVTIEHGDDPTKRKVQIFTAMPAVEMAEFGGGR